MHEQAHWVILDYLAAHGAPNVERPSHEELGLERVTAVVERCADLRGRARTLIPWNVQSLSLADDPWREILGIVGSVGESLMLAAGCEIEVEWHRRARDAGDLPRHFLIGQRFFSTAELQELLGIGHRLVNVTARAIASDPDLRARIADESDLRRWEAAHRPFSDDRDAWLSLNMRNVNALERAVSSSRHRSIRSLLDVLRDLITSDSWQQLDESRGRDFHRWRAESSVLAGVDEKSGHIQELPGPDGLGVGFAFVTERKRYERAEGLEEATGRLARAALDQVTAATDRLLDSLARAAEPLTGGVLVGATGDRFSVRLGHRWNETDCACCTETSPPE